MKIDFNIVKYFSKEPGHWSFSLFEFKYNPDKWPTAFLHLEWKKKKLYTEFFYFNAITTNFWTNLWFAFLGFDIARFKAEKDHFYELYFNLFLDIFFIIALLYVKNKKDKNEK